MTIYYAVWILPLFVCQNFKTYQVFDEIVIVTGLQGATIVPQ